MLQVAVVNIEQNRFENEEKRLLSSIKRIVQKGLCTAIN